MSFLDAGFTIGTGPLNASGVASFTTSSLAVGTHSLVAAYGGDVGFTGSTSAILTTVTQANTTVSVSSGTNPAYQGGRTMFTASVTSTGPGSGTPTGMVVFLSDGSFLGLAMLNGQGTAMISTPVLTSGNHTITATYGGNRNFAGSTSTSPLPLTVYTRLAGLTVKASSTSALVGGSVTFTATLAGSTSSTATMTFLDGGTSLGTASVSSGTATFTTASLSLGKHTITATYADNTGYTFSKSNTWVETVTQRTLTTLMPLALFPVVDEAVIFTASVLGSTGAVGGTVTFEDGTTAIGTVHVDGQGYATFRTQTLGLGQHTITAVYSGDNYSAGSTSAVANLTVCNSGVPVTEHIGESRH